MNKQSRTGSQAPVFDSATAQRVVVVEENEDARQTLGELLFLLGYTILSFPSAAGVLDALKVDDILFTAVNLQGQSGLELAQLARERFVNLRVIFSAGEILEPNTVDEKMLLKPFSVEQLDAALSAPLAN